jgi:RNA polymerase sigma factor (sigma-70 family)
LQQVLRCLRRATGPAARLGAPDAQLLDQFVCERDETAFELLVRRHAPMVVGVCRRVLRDSHDAEDASQATFVALARKAGSISRRESVGGWLYRVAYRMALGLRTRRGKRAARQRPLQDFPGTSTDPALEAAWRELCAVVDEEVNRLPERYRVPFVLSYFNGLSNAAIALELGCPAGTVESWLTRARTRLRRRLAQRGVSVSQGVLAALPMAQTTAVPLSEALINSLARTSAAVSADGATSAITLSPRVTNLANGVLRSMLIRKMKHSVGCVLAAAFVTWGGAALVHQFHGSTSAPMLAAAPAVEETAIWQVEPAFFEKENVQEELDLTDDQIGRLAKLATAVAIKNENQPHRVYLQMIGADFARALPDVLTGAQVKRLRQIQLQDQGMEAFADPEVERALHLDDDQKKAIATLIQDARKDLAQSMEEFAQQKRRDGRRPTVEEKRAWMRTWEGSFSAKSEILEVLTAKQRRIWNELIGEPFPAPGCA